MVVDDVADVRRVIRSALERDGRFVVVGEAADGNEAVVVARQVEPGLIVLDLDMPGVTGLEALPSLRSVVPAADIVVVSGLPREAWAGPALSAGAVGFIEKGIRSDRLISSLVEMTGLLHAVGRAMDERHVAVEQDPTAARLARRFVCDAIRDWNCENTRDVVELLVSELVTNAVTHARSEADVAVILRRDVIRVEVGDNSPDLPRPGRPAPDALSGRGLGLVEQLAAAWGVHPRDGGKVVWFEVARSDPHASTVIE